MSRASWPLWRFTLAPPPTETEVETEAPAEVMELRAPSERQAWSDLDLARPGAPERVQRIERRPLGMPT